jgi:hypothetical protein
VQTRAMGGALAWTVAAASTEVQGETKKGWVPETTFLLSLNVSRAPALREGFY